MPVQAQRFEFLDKETNVAFTDFVNADNSSVLNKASDVLKNIEAEIASFISNKNNTKPLTQKEKDLAFINGLEVRESTGLSLDMIDITKLNNTDIKNKIKDITGNNPVVTNLLDNLTLPCKNKALGKNKNQKRPKSLIDCNGNKRQSDNKCGTKEFGDSISKLTNGLFNFNFKDQSAILDRLLALSSMGFKLNLCGVFNALSAGVDLKILNKASSLLLKDVSLNKDMLAVLDLANSSLNLNVKSLLPDTSNLILSNYKTPNVIKEKNLPDFLNRVEGALTVFDSNWKFSDIDGALNLHNVSNNKSLKDVFKSKTMNTAITASQLDVAPNIDEAYIYTALA